MASKRRIRRSSCGNKVKYPSKNDALKKLFYMSRLYNDNNLDVYKCQFCNHWHVGHVSTKIKKQRKHFRLTFSNFML